MSDEKTNKLVAQWDRATQDFERMKQTLNSAEYDLRNATNALAKWLTPEDGQDNEKFSIWHSGRLLSVFYDKATGQGVAWERRPSPNPKKKE